MRSQAELFEAQPDPPSLKTHKSGSTVLSYYEEDGGKLLRVQDFRGAELLIRRSAGRYSAFLPEEMGGRIQARNKLSILGTIARLHVALVKHDEIARLNKEASDHVAHAISSLEAKADSAKPRSRNKLARDPIARKGDIRLINPKSLMGSSSDFYFGVLFAWLTNVPGVTPNERIAYGWLVFRADEDGVFRGSLRRLASDAGISRPGLQHQIIPSMLLRPLLVREDRGAGRADWFRFVDPEPFGWLTKLATSTGQLSLPRVATPISHTGQLSLPHKERVEELLQRTSNRANRAQVERDLLDQLGSITGRPEMNQNGGAWRKRIRYSEKAIRFAIEDWKLRTPAQRGEIRNPAAWLSDRYARALVEIDQAKSR